MNDQPHAPIPPTDPNHSEPSPDLFRTVPIRTEPHPNGSEPIPNEAETIPNRSEQTPAQPIEPLVRSEQTETESADTGRTAPLCSEQHVDFTITVREAARIFEEAGVPRTERAITKWCNQNARGITRLDCCYSDPERKYFITPTSIERVIKEERRKFQYTEYQGGGLFSTAAEDLAE